MRINSTTEKGIKIIKSLMFGFPNGFSFDYLLHVTKKFKKNKIFIFEKIINTMFKDVLNNFYYAGLLLGNTKYSYRLNLPNHNPNKKLLKNLLLKHLKKN